MKSLFEYLNTNVKPSMIHAIDENIKDIVKDELDKFGHDGDLNHIDVSRVINMDNLFSCDKNDLGSKYKDLNPDISKWNVSKVKNMSSMFYNCEAFNQDISQWDVSKVKDMSWMFGECKNFNQDISQWDVNNVTYMESMFYNCKNFNQYLSQWDVSKVENMQDMFVGCPIKEIWKPKFK
jgi:surface protein